MSQIVSPTVGRPVIAPDLTRAIVRALRVGEQSISSLSGPPRSASRETRVAIALGELRAAGLVEALEIEASLQTWWRWRTAPDLHTDASGQLAGWTSAEPLGRPSSQPSSQPSIDEVTRAVADLLIRVAPRTLDTYAVTARLGAAGRPKGAALTPAVQALQGAVRAALDRLVRIDLVSVVRNGATRRPCYRWITKA